MISGYLTAHCTCERETSTDRGCGARAVGLLISSIISHRRFAKALKIRVFENLEKAKGATAVTARPSCSFIPCTRGTICLP